MRQTAAHTEVFPRIHLQAVSVWYLRKRSLKMTSTLSEADVGLSTRVPQRTTVSGDRLRIAVSR